MAQSASSSPSLASAALLEQLPLDILDEICKFIAMDERRRPSLFAFSLASKTCYAAAARQRASLICINIHTPDKLRRDLERWNQMLLPGDHYRRVRIVKITGSMSLKAPDGDTGPSDTEEAVGDDEDFDHSWYPYDPCEPPRSIDFEERRITALRPQQKERRQEAWIPLAHFLTKLPALADFVHACSDQISPNVLSSLHQNCPRARLHMHNFSLRSCFQHRSIRPPFVGQPLIDCDSLIDNLHLNDWTNDIDEDDLAIMTSPCLYSIVVKYSSQPRKGLDRGVFSPYEKNYNEAIVKRMVAGMAPRLAHVRMIGYNFKPIGRPPTIDSTEVEQSLGPAVNLRKGHLESLTSVGLPVDEPWTLYTTFEKLKLLKIKSLRHPQSLSFLTELGHQGELGRLRRVSLHLEPKNEGSQKRMPGAVLQFVQSLQSLEVLTLRGALTRELCTGVFKACGKTLKYLTLMPQIIQRAPELPCQQLATLSYHDTEELVQNCPGLKALMVAMERPHDLKAFQPFGQLKNLRSLILYCDLGFSQCVTKYSDTDLDSEQNETQKTTTTTSLLFPEPRAGNCSSNAIAIFNTINGNSQNQSLSHLRIFPRDMLRTLYQDLGKVDICTVQRDSTGSISASVVSKKRRPTQKDRLYVF